MLEGAIEGLVVSAPVWFIVIAYGCSVLRKKRDRHKRLVREFNRYKKERDYWLDYDLPVEEFLSEQ